MLQKNDSWTRGSEKLTGKSAGDNKFYVTILAPGGAYGGEEWDSIVLMDNSIVQEAEQYKLDRAKEAAKEFSANGFKSLTMGMSIKSLSLDYMRIPAKADTDSDNCRTPIPIELGQWSERSDGLGLDIKNCPK